MPQIASNHMRRTFVWLALSFASVTLGCSHPDAPPGSEEIVWRLVDWPSVESTPAPAFYAPPRGIELAPIALARRGPSRALVGEEERYTFQRPELTFVHHDRSFEVPGSTTFPLNVGLPEPLRPCDVLDTDITFATVGGSTVEHVAGRCTGPANGRTLELLVTSPPTLRGAHVDLWVHGRPPCAQGIRQRRFTIPEVPPGARLAFSYGVESPGWEHDAAAATFHVLVDGNPKPLFFARLDPGSNPSQRRWFEASVDLGAYSGRRLSLVLQTAVDRADDRGPFSRPIWGNPMVIARRVGSTTPPNVILISIDALRARSIGAYGRERATTPFLDAFAREGVLFTQAVAQSTTTPASHMTLFTSLYPGTHGVTDLTHGSDLDAYGTLAEILRQHGYATAAVTEDGLLEPSLGFDRGFDSYTETKNRGAERALGHLEHTARIVAEWLAKRRDEPFFLFVHSAQVHEPYTPPSQYRGIFGVAGAVGPADALDRYEETVRYTDDQLAALWQSIAPLGVADHTIVVITSDHGEEFGEHGALGHGTQLFDETLLVPLIMRAPGLLPRGARVDAQVGLIDVLPTLLDLLHLPIPVHAEGRSLAALFHGDDDGRARLDRDLEQRELFAEAWDGVRMRSDGSVDDHWQRPLYASRTPTLKVLYAPVVPSRPTALLQTFDLLADPQERTPASSVPAAASDPLLHYTQIATRPRVAAPTFTRTNGVIEDP